MKTFCRSGLIGVAAVLLMLSDAMVLFAGTASLSWQAPTANTDGTSLTNLAGYKIYYGTTSGVYTQSINVGNVTTYTVANLTNGLTYYFVTTALNTSGDESGFSNQVSKLILSADATAPLGTVSINAGAAYTNTQSVTLTLSASDSGSGMGVGAQMKFSNDGVAWTNAEAYATSKIWALAPGDGGKTVYVMFKDVAGNWSAAAASDTITLDTGAPGKPGKPLLR